MFASTLTLGADRTKLLAAFMARLPLSAEMEPHLRNALQQTLQHPGSLIRAQLVYQLSQAWGLAQDRAEKLAVGIEYFHTASLIFDDLPCMDDATQRAVNLASTGLSVKPQRY